MSAITRRGLLALAASAFAAQRKNRAPISHEMLAIKLPEATPTRLSNGLTLLIMEDNRFPMAWARFHVDGAGRVYSPAPAVARFTASMLEQGSPSRSTGASLQSSICSRAD